MNTTDKILSLIDEVVSDHMIGFDLDWDQLPENFVGSPEEELLRKFHSSGRIDELCPSPNMWHFVFTDPTVAPEIPVRPYILPVYRWSESC